MHESADASAVRTGERGTAERVGVMPVGGGVLLDGVHGVADALVDDRDVSPAGRVGLDDQVTGDGQVAAAIGVEHQARAAFGDVLGAVAVRSGLGAAVGEDAAPSLDGVQTGGQLDTLPAVAVLHAGVGGLQGGTRAAGALVGAV